MVSFVQQDPNSEPSPEITIFTATYNRAHTLERLATSLRAQTSSVAFEWLIVDDGSTDHTERLIARLMPDLPFPVRYFKQANGGKHTAFNKGVQLAQGLFFLTIDSDDQLHPEGLNNAIASWNSIPIAERSKFQGVAGLCVDSGGALIGDPFPADIFDSNTPEVVFRHRVKGDKSGMHLTEAFRRHPFPEREGMKFLPEGRIWMELSKEYLTRYVNRPFAIVNFDAGANLSKLERKDKLEGDREYHGYMLREQVFWARYAPREFLMSALLYQVAVRKLHAAGSSIEPANRVGLLARFLLMLTWPLSLVPLTWLAKERHP